MRQGLAAHLPPGALMTDGPAALEAAGLRLVPSHDVVDEADRTTLAALVADDGPASVLTRADVTIRAHRQLVVARRAARRHRLGRVASLERPTSIL